MKTVLQNQLVFRGTRAEVDSVEAIDRCWYLAYDTGELFVGNAVGSKTKYGGSNKTLSDVDLIKKIEELFQSSYMEQLSINNSIINDMRIKVDSFDNKLNEMAYNTEQYLQQKIDELLNDLSLLKLTFVTKEEIEHYVHRDELYNYITKDEANDSFLIPMSGSDISLNISNNGYYLCTSDFINTSNINFSFYKGTIYHIINGKIEEIASAGGATTNRDFAINKFTIAGFNGTQVWDYGQTFSNITSIPVVTNFSYGEKATSIVLKYNGTEIQTSEPISQAANDHTVYIDFTGLSLNIGRNKFTLSALTLDGKNITSTINIDVVRPIYYGAAGEAIFESENMESTEDESGNIIIDGDVIAKFDELTKLTKIKNPTRVYTINITQEKPYLWICVPVIQKDAMNITKILNTDGFRVPYNTFQSSSLEYRCYRSTNALSPQTINADVTGTGGNYN